ncbi:MAG: GNAT family N-acetyltransferase [Dissulfurimicrobium sp.]|uniref:GNAT family N-acetyltransferase n=1 Tax=Dissulfurimicrobium sp. TaxID=2022436 RepID=UPI003D13C6E9
MDVKALIRPRPYLKDELGLELRVIVRPAREADLPWILAIEEASHPRPWSRMDFEKELGGCSPLSHLWVTVPVEAGIVARCGVVGYVCFRWIAPVQEVYIINLTVAPDFRRCGVAAGLMDICVRWAKRRKGMRVVLDVRRDNLPAIAFYKKMGFVAAYGGTDGPGISMRDSMVMTLSIGG